jgi:cytosine/adenosine deaminase-related metal-dependent hydrolase
MSRIIKADLVFTNAGPPLEGGAVEVDDNGFVAAVYSAGEVKHKKGYESYHGFLVPGFVNAHCHLELSFAAARIERGKGIDNFIERLEELKRGIPADIKKQSAANALELMKEEGIVAVGDICNTELTAELKPNSRLKFRNFIEVYGLDPAVAEEKIIRAKKLKAAFENSSIVPHSAYSLSQNLFEMTGRNIAREDIISVHHQESKGENRYFAEGNGPLAARFKSWGLQIPDFIPTKYKPAELLAQFLGIQHNKTLFVHNTFSTENDIDRITEKYSQPSFCLCPSSNLFLEESLPPAEMLARKNVNICLGTDSLASTDTLSILHEIKILQKAFPQLTTEFLIRAATLNGAVALGFDDLLGSFEKGKKPGVVLIEDVDIEKRKINDFAFARVIV